jgi:type II secretory pathway component PulC
MKRVIALSLVAIMGILVGGCSSSSLREPRYIDDIRPVPPPMKVLHYSIQRKDLQDALVQQGVNTIRLVPVFENLSVSQSYTYRLFDVQEGSAYALLGLQSSDVVVAADRYLIKRPDQFPSFVSLLAGVDEATIEIRRGGESKLFKYNFIPALGKKSNS